jgi:hypothetical protein
MSNFNLSSALEKQLSLLCDALYIFSKDRSPIGSGHISIGRGATTLSCIMPELYRGQSLERAFPIFSPRRPSTPLETLKILLYALSNSLTNSLRDMETTITFARTFLNAWADRPQRPFNDLSTEPTLLMLLEKYFQAACNSLDLDVMDLCLKMGASPNLIVWNNERNVFIKPIQIAVFEEHIKATKYLVSYSTVVNGIRSQKIAYNLIYSILASKYTDIEIPT